MIALAGDLGWLSPAEQRAELMQMIGDQVARNTVGAADVDLICTLNKDHELDQELDRLQLSPAQSDNPAHAALQACLGSADARARVLLALTSPDDEEVQVAQVYLGHQPITDVNELRLVTARVARMNSSKAQIRALETLASQRLSDPDSLEELARLFPLTESVGVQTAIAGVLIRSDYQAIATPEFVQTLRQTPAQVFGWRRLDRRPHPTPPGRVVLSRASGPYPGRQTPPEIRALRSGAWACDFGHLIRPYFRGTVAVQY